MDNIPDNRKSLFFAIDEDTHARLRIQLKYDRMTQTMFVNAIIKGYLDNNPYIRDYIDQVVAEKASKRIQRNRRNDRKEEAKQIQTFMLDDKEIENIFDILERENPDL